MKRRTFLGAILAACSFGLLGRALPPEIERRRADFEPILVDAQGWVVLVDRDYAGYGNAWIEAVPSDYPGTRIVRITTVEQDEIDDERKAQEWAAHMRAKAARRIRT